MDELNFDQEIAALVAPLTAARPAGRDLDEGLDLNALETSARDPDEPSIQGISAADTRDWRTITKQARDLLAQSKDLRVAVLYTRALLHTQGLAGFGRGLAIVRTLVEHHWADCYPVLDEDGDPQGRLNIIGELWTPSVLSQLRASKVVSVRDLGTFNVDDVLVAKGSPLGRPASVSSDVQDVLRALTHGPKDDLQRVRNALAKACEELPKLGAAITAAAKSSSVLNYSALLALPGSRTQGLLDTLAQTLALATGETAQASADTPAEGSSTGSVQNRGIDTREDVLRLLDRICEFYAKSEPASPVPFVLQRVKRLVTMDFVELLRELADQGLPQFEVLAGKTTR